MEVDSDIPIPPVWSQKGPRTERGRAVHAMKVGDSVLCRDESERDTVRSALRKLGG